MSELKDLASVPFLIIAPRDGKPIVEVVQDSMLGAYRISKDWVRIHEKTMANLQMVNSYFTGEMPKPDEASSHTYTGKQAVSQILPPGMFINMKNRAGETLRIQDSKLVSGTLDKPVFHSMSKGIIPVLYHDYSPFEVRRFLDNTQRLIMRWLTTSGFSVGISDLVTDKDTEEKLKESITNYKGKAYKKMEDVRKGQLDNNSIFSNEDFFEREILNVLNDLTKVVGKIGMEKINEKTNRMINMVKSGSKGKETNVAQMVACVGQQNVDGKRVAYGFTDRTLPHYTKYDDGPEARGFVENSFISGLTPQEVFFHAMGGREGLIDTAVKSVTGDTTLVIIENNNPRYVRIGDWIDGYITKYQNDVQHYDERKLELLYINEKVPNKVYIPTTDADGNVTWGEVTALTRHDPGEALYHVKTAGGREVTVVESKSLLVWDEATKKFTEKLTTEVKVGEYMPVTMNMITPPIVVKEVNMSEYFPCNKYVHGSEFIKAVELMQKSMNERTRIPRGWWDQHNGRSFTLPYVKKASLQRAVVRSNTSNIKKGYIYPYHATREHGWIPDMFPLTHENGVFIGLFLAEGNTCMQSGRVQIANNDDGVKAFVKQWFQRHNISWEAKERINAIGGTSSHVAGFSVLLAQFLDEFVGKGAYHKRVPDVAFAAPEEFIIGLLNGYLTGDGTITENSIEASSASPRLIEGVSMLATRLGAFGKVFVTQTKSNNLDTPVIAPAHRIAFRAQWAHILQGKLHMLSAKKNAQLRAMQPTEHHRNFEQQNDVVCDKITQITKKDIGSCTKVYDLTIPSTLNFGLANGLHVYDTSETGYIQRRLVKAMEDCKIYYDQTVRNATGAIVQFLYGEDGMDGTKMERQTVPTIGMNLIQLDAMYHLRAEDKLDLYLSKEALAECSKSPEWIEGCAAHYEEILNDRLFLIEKVFNGQKNDKITYPVPFERIISTAQNRMAAAGLKGMPTDLTPSHILAAIKELKEQLVILRPNQGIRFLHVLLNIYLSPKPLLTQYVMAKPIFDWVVSEIKRYFITSVAHAGEMVGIIAAQSLGELNTQLSCSKDTRVLVKKPGSNTECMYYGEIGALIDQLIASNPSKVIDLGHGSVALPLEESFYVVGVSKDEKTSWARISEVSRHYANGGMVKVTTRTGRTTTATLSHSFLKRTPWGIEPVLGSDLSVGDRIPIARSIPVIDDPLREVPIGDKAYALDREFGWILGAYLADGSYNHGGISISKVHPAFEENIRAFGSRYNIPVSVSLREVPNNFGADGKKDSYPTKDTVLLDTPLRKWVCSEFKCGSYNKRVPGWVFASNKEFIAGILAGYFDGDGNVHADRQLIRAHSVNEGLIDDILVLLNYCGIFSKKLIERRKREKANKLYVAHVQHKYAQAFATQIRLTVPHKYNALRELCDYNEKKECAGDHIDMIPEVDGLLDYVGKALKISGQSRMYGKYKRLGMNRISRNALIKYTALFKSVYDLQRSTLDTATRIEVAEAIGLLEQAAHSDVVWDEIVQLEYLSDPKEYVYDFSVPGANETFMVDAGVLVHNTLDSFHSSGTAAAVKATSGVPRLKELLSVSKNIKTPTMIIYLKPDIASVVNPSEDENGDVNDPRVQEAKERAMRIMHMLETTKLHDVLDATEVYWDPAGEDGLGTGMEEDDGMLDIYRAFSDIHKCRSKSPWVLRMKLNREKMYRLGLTMMDVYLRIYMAYSNQVECIFSDDNAPDLVLRVRLTSEALKDVDPDDVLAAMKAMEHNLVNNILLKGMKGIKKVSMRLVSEESYENEKDAFSKTTQWTLDTDGTNLIEMLAQPNVDPSRTRSNDVWEIYHTLGIEAARNALYKEFIEVVGDDTINFRHMALLLDTMTNKGTLMSVDRHGINRGDVGPLAKSSFEETTDMLINASIFSEYDRINGVSANIMLGQLPPCGTGDHEVILDEERYMDILKDMKSSGPAARDSSTADTTEIIAVEDVRDIMMPYEVCDKPKKKVTLPTVTFA